MLQPMWGNSSWLEMGAFLGRNSELTRGKRNEHWLELNYEPYKIKKNKMYWMPNIYCLIRSNQWPRNVSVGQAWEHELDPQNPCGKACYDSTHHSNLSNGEMETRGFLKCGSQANFSHFGPVWGSVSEVKTDGLWGTTLGGSLLSLLTRAHTCS